MIGDFNWTEFYFQKFENSKLYRLYDQFSVFCGEWLVNNLQNIYIFSCQLVRGIHGPQHTLLSAVVFKWCSNYHSHDTKMSQQYFNACTLCPTFSFVRN